MNLEYSIKHQSKINSMSKKEIKEYANEILVNEIIPTLENFLKNNYPNVNMPMVKINSRIKKTLAWYIESEELIEMSQYVTISGNYEFIIDTALHELIHHICCSLGLQSDDGDDDFENMLKKHNVSSTKTTSFGDNLEFVTETKCQCTKWFSRISFAGRICNRSCKERITLVQRNKYTCRIIEDDINQSKKNIGFY